MRGGLDDALERLARMDQLRRRAGGGASNGLPTAHGLAEAIEAVRRVVERHPDLNVTLYGEQGKGSAEVRIGWEDGVVRAKIVSVEGPEGASFGPGEGPLPMLPAEIPPMSDLPLPLTEASRPRVEAYPGPHRPEPPPVPEVPRLMDPGRLADLRRRHPADTGFLPDPGGLAASEPGRLASPGPGGLAPGGLASGGLASGGLASGGLASGGLASGGLASPGPGGLASSGPGGNASSGPARVEEPLLRSAPRAWTAEPEDNGAAARLAAMIREDPSLLAGPDER